MEPNKIALNLRGTATKWEVTHPIIGVGQLRVHDALNDAADCIEKLQAELEASQRRERAAVRQVCNSCRAIALMNGVVHTCHVDCMWRSPEQEGK